jgi:hypothetical protein
MLVCDLFLLPLALDFPWGKGCGLSAECDVISCDLRRQVYGRSRDKLEAGRELRAARHFTIAGLRLSLFWMPTLPFARLVSLAS